MVIAHCCTDTYCQLLAIYFTFKILIYDLLAFYFIFKLLIHDPTCPARTYMYMQNRADLERVVVKTGNMHLISRGFTHASLYPLPHVVLNPS